MKFDTYSDYDPRATSQTLPAFLTVWPGLGTRPKIDTSFCLALNRDPASPPAVIYPW